MATYTLISSNVLASSAASVTFSAIPATYTDLVLRYSARGTTGGTTITAQIVINSDTASNYSRTNLYGDGSSATSVRGTSDTLFYYGFSIVGSSATANTFSNAEAYFPNYTVSSNKPYSAHSANETNATAADMGIIAGLWRNSAAINSFVISAISGNIASGSSFYLYGISNA